MRTSARVAATTAAVVVALGVVFGAWYLNTYYGRTVGADPDAASGSPASAAPAEEEGPVTLRIVTEERMDTAAYQGHSVLYGTTQAMLYFKTLHPEVKLEIQVLPIAGQERESALSQLRLEIMAGEGPDVYLLPCGQRSPDDAMGEPLFADVTQAMESGTFFDLSLYYDGDEDLATTLNASIMEVGVLDGRRFTLPLGYNRPVLYVDREGLAAYGLAPEDLPDTLAGLRELAQTSGEAALMAGVSDLPSQCLVDSLGAPVDYQASSVTLDGEEAVQAILGQWALAEPAQAVRDSWTRRGVWPTATIPRYLIPNYDYTLNYARSAGATIFQSDVGQRSQEDYYARFLFGEEYPLSVGWLAQAQETVVIARSLGRDVEVLPLRTPAGETCASVTFFGAVDAHSERPALAFTFLRMFLTSEVQLMEGLGVYAEEEGVLDMDVSEPLNSAMPVVQRGVVKALVRKRLGLCHASAQHNAERYAALRDVELTDDLLPILAEPVDLARFPTQLDEDLAALLEGDPMGESQLREAVAQCLREAQYRVGEG